MFNNYTSLISDILEKDQARPIRFELSGVSSQKDLIKSELVNLGHKVDVISLEDKDYIVINVS